MPDETKQLATDYWERKWRGLDALLAPFPRDQRHLRLTICADEVRYDARAVLMLPTGTLVANGRSRGSDFAEALDEVADRLASEIRRHKGLVRQEYLYHRRRARREDFSGILSTLEQCYAMRAREAFAELLRPALRGLSEHAHRELIVAQLEGVVRPGELSVSDVLDELIARAWMGFARRPDSPLDRWLTRLLHEILDERGPDPVLLQLADPVSADDPRFAAKSGWEAETEPYWPTFTALTMDEAAPTDDRGQLVKHAKGDEEQRWILAQLLTFTRQQRRAFTLYTLEGWNEDDIATFQGRPPQEILSDVEAIRDAITRKLLSPH